MAMSDNTIALDGRSTRGIVANVGRLVWSPTFVAGAAIAGSALLTGHSLLRQVFGGWLIASNNTTQYWVSYSDGFVRRGLPGEVLRRAFGGPPTAAEAYCTAALLAVLAVVSL